MHIIEKTRREKGLSVEEVADLVNISISNYEYIEGHFEVGNAYLCKCICVMLGVDFDSIY